MLGSVQAQPLAAARDPAPTWPISLAIGDPPPNNFWQVGESAEDSQKRLLSLYTPVSKRPVLRLIISFLFNFDPFPLADAPRLLSQFLTRQERTTVAPSVRLWAWAKARNSARGNQGGAEVT